MGIDPQADPDMALVGGGLISLSTFFSGGLMMNFHILLSFDFPGNQNVSSGPSGLVGMDPGGEAILVFFCFLNRKIPLFAGPISVIYLP